jgi:hypothetical protein
LALPRCAIGALPLPVAMNVAKCRRRHFATDADRRVMQMLAA